MQIKKINNYKLEVVLNKDDLAQNDIDVNSFMANSLESQELFLDILDLAEEKFNFFVDNSKLAIESICLANNIFIFTITKLSEQENSNYSNYIYCFNSFDNLSYILSIINNDSKATCYMYNNKFYLIVEKSSKYNSIINEFSDSKNKLECFENILMEHGVKCS